MNYLLITLLTVVTICSSYNLGPHKWQKTKLTYKVTSYREVRLVGDLSRAETDRTVESVMKMWSSVSAMSITKTTRRADIEIGFFKGNHGDNQPFRWSGNYYHFFRPQPNNNRLNGDIHLSGYTNWVSPFAYSLFELNSINLHSRNKRMVGPEDTYNFHRMLTHMVGFALGLEHSDDSGSAMWTNLSVMNNRGIQKLGADDERAMRALYGGVCTDCNPCSPPEK